MESSIEQAHGELMRKAYVLSQESEAPLTPVSISRMLEVVTQIGADLAILAAMVAELVA